MSRIHARTGRKHTGRTLCRGAIGPRPCALVAGVILLSVALSSSSAAARPLGLLTPKITGFKVKPSSLESAGGEVELSAKLPGIATCTVSVTPSYAGLPSPFECGNSVKWRYVTVPPNNSPSTVSYSYIVTAKYTDGTSLTSKAKTVTVKPPTAATTYVALGDSYSAGQGNPAKSPKSWVDRPGKGSEITNGCNRSAVSYPMLVAKWLPKKSQLGAMDLRFLACSGATTEDLWHSGAFPTLEKPNNIEWKQLEDTADLKKARIVTVTIGGNDLGFADILANCIDVVLHKCNEHSNDGWIANLQGNIGKLQPFLESTYKQIESATSNAAALYVVGYPDLLPKDASQDNQAACALVTGIPEYGVSYLIENQTRLSETVHRAATNAGAYFVDPNSQPAGRTFVGRDVCAPDPWFNAPDVVNPEYSFHPNPAGQNALAEDVEAAITHESSPSGGGGGCSAGAVARRSAIGAKSLGSRSSAPLEPKFSLEMLQRICGSSGGFTKSVLTATVGQTVEYESVIVNLGNVPLTFSNLVAYGCDSGTTAGGPGTSPVAPGESSIYTCSHVLTSAGTWPNVSAVTGFFQGSPQIVAESNEVVTEAP